MRITREEAREMADAHGSHIPPDGIPREGCPECEGRDLSEYPPASSSVFTFGRKQRVEHEAWGAVMQELRNRGVGDVNAGGKDEPLHDAICAWAEELVQLRMADPDPENAKRALRERRDKYLGTEETWGASEPE
jgi:hypothetical protein